MQAMMETAGSILGVTTTATTTSDSLWSSSSGGSNSSSNNTKAAVTGTNNTNANSTTPTVSSPVVGMKRIITTIPNSQNKNTTTMLECFECDDPISALQEMSSSSVEMIQQSTKELQNIIQNSHNITSTVPPLLRKENVRKDDHPLTTMMTCSKSILHHLYTISENGKDASNEIRILELQKNKLNHHASVILTAVHIRQSLIHATNAYYTQQNYYETANAIRPYIIWKQQHEKNNKKQTLVKSAVATVVAAAAAGNDDTSSSKNDTSTTNTNNDILNDPRLSIYIGEYTIVQLHTIYTQLRTTLLSLYETAVHTSDLHTLGVLTPILSIIQLEYDGLRLYKVYLLSLLDKSMSEETIMKKKNDNNNDTTTTTTPPPYVAMGRIYNIAVSTIRHHLPMVSQCLHSANGDISIVQLIHNQTEHYIIPIVQQYQNTRQLIRVSRTAIQIYNAIEDRYTGRNSSITNINHRNNNTDPNNHHHMGNVTTDDDDCGFHQQIGTLSDVAITMEEVAMCIQHTESYLRFIHHTCMEVNRARKLRHTQTIEHDRIERERQEYTKSGKNSNNNNNSSSGGGSLLQEDDMMMKKGEEETYHDVEILSSSSTPLHECIAEIGGQYAAIERCLLIASMQRAFDYTNEDDPKSYRPMSTLSSSSSLSGNNTTISSSSTIATTNGGGGIVVDAWQTILVETCWYAARRGTQRAFATGHTGTASVVTNYIVECFTDVCLPVLTRRAEEYGVHPLKPGDGLLVGGSINIFNNASNLIRQGGGAVTSLQLPTSVTTTTVGGSSGSSSAAAANKNKTEELLRKQKRDENIIRACAMMNDMEVAIHHTKQLESILYKLIDKGFAPNTHETEHLRMCVKALSPVADAFQGSSNTIMETLESILKPRIRSIVSDAVGVNDVTTTSTFIGAVTTTTLGGSTKSHFGGGGGGGSSSSDHHYGRHSDMMRMNYNLDEEAYNLMQLSEGYVSRLCTLLDELLNPLRKHLAPRLWDMLLLYVMSTVCKRLETSYLRKCEYTALGGLSLESDMRDLLSYTKDHLHNTDYNSNTMSILKACPSLSKLLQISKLLSVDEIEDVADVIINLQRKGNWDLNLDDTKTFLYLRVEFDSNRVNDILHLPDDE